MEASIEERACRVSESLSPVRWACRGAAIGTIVALGESLLALSTGEGLPVAYLGAVLLSYSLVAGASTLATGLVIRRVVSRVEIPFPGVIVVFASILSSIWTFDVAVDASSFRGSSPALGVFLLLLGMTIATAVGWRLAARWLASIRSEPALVAAVPLIILALESVRFLHVDHFSLLMLAGAGLAVVVIVCVRVFSSPRFAAFGAGSVLAVTLPVSAGAISVIWSLDQGSPIGRLRPAPPAVESVDRRPNVILITLDTLRADHLGLYGYARRTSASLDDLSSDSLVFRNAISPASWTLPAHASMFTGLLPRRHGAHFTEDWSGDREAYFGASVLGTEHLTLAEMLAASGYETAAFVSNFGLLTRDMGMSQGFQLFDDRPGRMWGYEPTLHSWLRFYPHVLECLSKSYRPAVPINDEVFRWLAARRRSSRPFFLFINYMDSHSPYCPPEPFARAFAGRDLRIGEPEAEVFRGRELTPQEARHFRALYDGGISYLDFALGRLLERLHEAGLYEDALLIVTSDHGEYFGEHHLWGHGYGPYDEVYRVPLLVKYPGRSRVGREDGYVSTVDIFATVLDEVGIRPPVGGDSVVLGSTPRTVVVEQYGNTHMARYYGERFKRSFRAFYEYPWKYVAYSDGEELLLDLSRDPGETLNVVGRHQDVAAYFRNFMSEWLAQLQPHVPAGSYPGLSPEQLRRLRALGYVE